MFVLMELVVHVRGLEFILLLVLHLFHLVHPSVHVLLLHGFQLLLISLQTGRNGQSGKGVSSHDSSVMHDVLRGDFASQ